MSRVLLQTLLDRSIRNMGKGMNSVVYETALEVLKRAYSEGINIQITAGMRTMEQQAALYGQGRSSYVYNGKQYAKPNMQRVTNAQPGYSNHNFGLAVDYVLISLDGTKAIWTVNKEWRRVATIAKGLGFAWGGDWKGFVDNPHLEMMGGLSMAHLRSGQRPRLTLKFTPNKTEMSSPQTGGTQVTAPSAESNLLQKDSKGAAVKSLQEDLISLGYKLPTFGADSHFGDETDSAVRAFQKDQGLVVDGIVGPATLNKLAEAKKALDKKIDEFKGTAQRFLNSRGYPGARKGNFKPLVIDSVSGPLSKNAVIRIAQYFGKTTVDGLVGPKTLKVVATIRRDSTSTWWNHLLQAALNLHGAKLAVDGLIGLVSERSIKAFQKSKSLTQDGIVGPKTWEVLFK